MVLDKMPAVVWALTVECAWLGDKTLPAAGLTSAGHKGGLSDLKFAETKAFAAMAFSKGLKVAA